MEKKLPILLIIFFFICLIYSPFSYAEKMRIALIEDVDSSVKIAESIKKNLSNTIRERLINSGKFEIVERNERDLRKLFEEQKFSDSRIGRVDVTDEKKAEFGKIAGVEYLVFITLNDFHTGIEHTKFKKVNVSDKYFVSLGANIKIVNSSTGKIKTEKSISAKEYHETSVFYQQGDFIDQELVNKAVLSLCNKVVRKIIDELYPIKIVDRNLNVAFINRGKEQGIKVGDILEVFAIKKAFDEDTHEEINLEYSVGKIKVTSASDKTAQVEIIEDFGITKGCIAKVLDAEENTVKNIEENLNKKLEADDW